MRTAVVSLSLVALACSPELLVLEQDNGDCVPLTCEELAAECGVVPSGCGRALECGGCADGSRCGELVPNRCGASCAPLEGLGRIVHSARRDDAVVEFERVGTRILGHTV